MGVRIRQKPNGSGVWWVFIHHKNQRASLKVGSEKAARKTAEMICNQKGNRADIGNIKKRVFNRCLGMAKLRRIRFHDLRHTFASLHPQNGESPVYVKEQLGHSSIKMTVDVYGHLIPGANREAANRLPSLRRISAPTPHPVANLSAIGSVDIPEVIEKVGTPGRSRTCDLLIRSQTLYPAELRAHQ